MPGETATSVAASRPGSLATVRRHERVAAEITAFLGREGPQTIGRIRSLLYGRFIGLASADVVIAQSPRLFVRSADGLISLRDADDLGDAEFDDFEAPPAHVPLRRVQFWR